MNTTDTTTVDTGQLQINQQFLIALVAIIGPIVTAVLHNGWKYFTYLCMWAYGHITGQVKAAQEAKAAKKQLKANAEARAAAERAALQAERQKVAAVMDELAKVLLENPNIPAGLRGFAQMAEKNTAPILSEVSLGVAEAIQDIKKIYPSAPVGTVPPGPDSINSGV